MAQLRRFENEWRQRGAQVALISFGTPLWAKAFLQDTGAGFPLLLDPEREVYAAYGLERSLLRAYSPQVIWYYLKAMAGGRGVSLKSKGDPYQLGGDFVVARDGTLVYAQRSSEPTDRPSPEALLAELDRIRG